jgi:transposase
MALSLLKSRQIATAPCHVIFTILFAPRFSSDVRRKSLKIVCQPRVQGFSTKILSTEAAEVAKEPLNMQKRLEIISLLDDLSIKDITRKLSLPYHVVYRFIRKYKQTGSIAEYKVKRFPIELDAEQRTNILTSINDQGLSLVEISRTMSLPYSRIYAFVRRCQQINSIKAFGCHQPATPDGAIPPPAIERLNEQHRAEIVELLEKHNLSAYMISRATSLPYRLVLSFVRAYKKTGSTDKHPRSREKINPQDRKDIMSYYTIGVGAPEIADVMSMPVKSVYSVLYLQAKAAPAGEFQRHLTTIEERRNIVTAYEAGLSSIEIAAQTSIPPAIVDNIIKWYKETGDVDILQRRYPGLTTSQMDKLRQMCKEHPLWPIARIARESGINVSGITIWRFCRKVKVDMPFAHERAEM